MLEILKTSQDPDIIEAGLKTL